MNGNPRKILVYPDQRLREVSKPVEVADLLAAETQQLIEDMFVTMHIAEGIGLSAIQIGVPKRILIVHIDEPWVLVNPKITVVDNTEYTFNEGCLSIPGVYEQSSKPKTIDVEYLDRNGNPKQDLFSNLHSACIQHEHEHLDGNLFTDSISSLKEQRYRRTIKKTLRSYKNDSHKNIVY